MAGNPPIKLIIFFAALSAMTLTFVLNINHSNLEVEKSSINNIDHVNDQEDVTVMPFKRVGRFLAEDPKPRNPNAADHCNKDNQVCTLQGNNATCCNNKCQDLSNDKKNCGACKNKCKYTETCCRGECVDVTYDKRHCGKCNNPCKPGAYCTYSLCDYA